MKGRRYRSVDVVAHICELIAAYTYIICNRLESNLPDNFVGHYWWNVTSATCCTIVKNLGAIFQKVHTNATYMLMYVC